MGTVQFCDETGLKRLKMTDGKAKMVSLHTPVGPGWGQDPSSPYSCGPRVGPARTGQGPAVETNSFQNRLTACVSLDSDCLLIGLLVGFPHFSKKQREAAVEGFALASIAINITRHSKISSTSELYATCKAFKR